MQAIHARWYCLHICLCCFLYFKRENRWNRGKYCWNISVVWEEWVWIDLFSFQTGVVGEHIQRQCHSKPVKEEAVLTEHESESGVTHTFTACHRGKAISTKTNADSRFFSVLALTLHWGNCQDKKSTKKFLRACFQIHNFFCQCLCIFLCLCLCQSQDSFHLHKTNWWGCKAQSLQVKTRHQHVNTLQYYNQ